MKRFERNRLQKKAVDFFQKHHFNLQKLAFWSKQIWRVKVRQIS